MSAHDYGFSGWDVLERRYGRLADSAPNAEIAISADSCSIALLVEMERPPWWREIDARRKALKGELA